MNIETIMDAIGFLGTIAFGVSGAMAGIKKRLDLFGVIVLAVVTATGGGITRDIFLDRLPPLAFIDTDYIVTAALSAIAVYIIARCNRDYYIRNSHAIDAVTNIFDASGLGIFVVSGAQSAIDSGFCNNVFFVLFIGVVTGIGGGFLRDIMIREIPFVLKKRFYALAALSGGFCYYLLYTYQLSYAPSVITSVLVTFSLRILATHYKWNLPKAL